MDKIIEEYNCVAHKYCHLPIAENIESYIATFFWWFDTEIINQNDESIFSGEVKSELNQAKKKSILNYDFDNIHKHKTKDGVFMSFLQLETEYDEKNGIIFLNADEEDFLNKGYFEQELDKRFNDVINSINDFYLKFKETNRYTLLTHLKEIPSCQMDMYVNEPKINYNNLNIDLFKDVTSQKWKKLDGILNDKIHHLENKNSNQKASLIVESNVGERRNNNGGLILVEGCNMTNRRAERLCRWLKQESYIGEETNYLTLKNIFVKKSSHIATKVCWMGYNHELKFFINQLHENKIIKPSKYQKKWSDVIACFSDRNGDEFENKSFSKNPEFPSFESKKRINSIVSRLLGDFTG